MKILVTGATGKVGQTFIRRVLEDLSLRDDIRVMMILLVIFFMEVPLLDPVAAQEVAGAAQVQAQEIDFAQLIAAVQKGDSAALREVLELLRGYYAPDSSVVITDYDAQVLSKAMGIRWQQDFNFLYSWRITLIHLTLRWIISSF